MEARADRSAFWLALIVLFVGSCIIPLPLLSTGFPGWSEPLFYVGVPTLLCVLILFIGDRQRAFRIPIMLLICAPFALIEVFTLRLVTPDTPFIRELPGFVCAAVFISLTILYLFRGMKRSPRPKIANIKWVATLSAGVIMGLFMVLISLASIEIPYINEFWLTHRARVSGISAILILIGIAVSVISHLIDLWKNGPTAEGKPDYEDLIAGISGKEKGNQA